MPYTLYYACTIIHDADDDWLLAARAAASDSSSRSGRVAIASTISGSHPEYDLSQARNGEPDADGNPTNPPKMSTAAKIVFVKHTRTCTGHGDGEHHDRSRASASMPSRCCVELRFGILLQ